MREVEYWREGTAFPVDLLMMALDDPEEGSAAASALTKLHDLGVLQRLDAEPNEEALARITSLSETFTPAHWMWAHTTSHLVHVMRGLGWSLAQGTIVDNVCGPCWEYPLLVFRA